MEVFDLLTQHVSVSDFEATPLSAATKQQLLTAAHAGSSSNFVQATSIIEVQAPALRNELAEISQSAAYVKKSGAFFVFVADLYRQVHLLEAAGQPVAPVTNLESFLVSVVDTTIAAENMAVAAEAQGLGICFIGGLRNDLARVAELLHLPKYTVPLFGLTIGVPRHKNGVKPRLPLANFTAVDTYPAAQFTALGDYDEVVRDYYLHRPSHPKDTDWTTTQRDFFATLRRPAVAAFVKAQGFELTR